MKVEQPTNPRFTIRKTATSLSIKIPARRRFYSILSLSSQVLFWILFALWGWSFVDMLSDTRFVENPWELLFNNPVPSLILLMAIIMWGVFGRYIIYSWLWEIFGYEIVDVTVNVLLIQQMVFGYSR